MSQLKPEDFSDFPVMRFNCDEVAFAGWAIVLLVVSGCGRSTSSELDWANGNWHGTRRDAANGDGLPMIVSVETIDGAQVERLQVESTPRPYVGFTVRTCDGSGRWTMTYANSTRPKISRLAGKLEGNRSIWESSSTGSDKSHGSRFVSERIDQDHWRRTQFVLGDGDGSWTVLFTDELERDPGKAETLKAER